MKINFDAANYMSTTTTNARSNVNVSASQNITTSWEVGKTLGDNNTYEGRRKSASEIIQGLQATDVSVTQDYLTVMSHSMSTEDYNRMVQEGINPMDVNVEDSTTILDRIKLYVARGGTQVEGFTDSLDRETLRELTGLETVDLESLSRDYDVTLDETTALEIGKAVEKAADITEINDGMKVFLLNTDAELTIDNLYLAKHSAMGTTREQGSTYFGIEAKGYLVKKGEISSDDSLASEVEALLAKSGLGTDKESVENGVWLVNNSIPVTGLNLDRLREINSLKLPLSMEKLASACVKAVAMGRPAEEAGITSVDNIYREAADYAAKLADSNILDPSLITRTRVFEETRLKMLSEANLLLLKSNYSIDTAQLEQYVEELKKLESNPEFSKVKELEENTEIIEAIKAAPVDVIGVFAQTIGQVTVQEIFDEGDRIRQRYELAGKAYEQLATEVRRDLGDSIKKAFSNVDDILEDLGYERTDENRRAVRILGYNSMPINHESVEKVKEADRKIQNILTRISPMDTLTLIREGRSPVKMSVDELNTYLDENENTQQKEIEKYSKFLFKLEKSNAITEDERQQFIEVYRFFHQLEKKDFAAVGSVLNSGSELTISNLKTAIKTAKSRGMDVSVDDSFGFLVEGIRRELEPERIMAVSDIEGKTLNEVYDELREVPLDYSLEQEYVKEELAFMRETMKAPEEVISELLMNRVPVSANTLTGMKMLMKQRGHAFSDVKEADEDTFYNISDEIIGGITDEESVHTAYSEAMTRAEEAVYEQALNEDRFVDVKVLQHTHIALSVARELSDSENYEVPVEIGGEVTSINLKIVHNSSEEANVVVSFETKKLGRVSARLSKHGEDIKGYIACNLHETLSKMQEVADKLGREVYTVMSDRSDNDAVLAKIPMKDNDEHISSAALYETAHAFLEAVKGIDK